MRAAVIGVCLAGIPIVVWITFVEIPRAQLSLLRYELWALRDELADRVLKNECADDAVAVRLLDDVESLIRGAQTHLLERAGIAFIATRLGYLKDPRTVIEVTNLRDDAHHEDLAYLDDWNARVDTAMTRYLLTGSPLGWALHGTAFVLRPLLRKWLEAKQGSATTLGRATARMQGETAPLPLHAQVA